MSLDAELEQLREDWQAEHPISPDLRNLVEKQTRWMRWMLAADVLVTIGIGGGFTAWAALSPGPGLTTLAVATWLFIAVAWTFRLLAYAGQWKPAALDTASFVDLAVRRCRSRIWAAYFGCALYVAELGYCLTWIHHYQTDQSVPLLVWLSFSSVTVDLVWILTLFFAVAAFRYWRTKRAQLDYLLGLASSEPEQKQRAR